jgi:signal transduction histidine kinase
MSADRTQQAHSARVAAIATLIVLALYVVSVLAINFVVVRRLTNVVDGRLTAQAQAVASAGAAGATAAPLSISLPASDSDTDDAQVRIWRVSPSGAVIAKSAGAPALTSEQWSGAPVTVLVQGAPYRIVSVRSDGGWVVAGQNISEISRVQAFLLTPELIVGLLLVLSVFFASYLIGLRASAPLEELRRRQAEFTADASHELRTPLSVIEAEVDLALSRPRSTEEYVGTLERVGSESARLRSIVEDLLWLARAAAQPGQEDFDHVDVAQHAASCVERFGTLSRARGLSLRFEDSSQGSGVIRATDDWVDRLLGVLVDNACKFAGSEGRVEVKVRSTDDRTVLVVEDSGPGIDPEERERIFDRFRRAQESEEGTGLGLAIADTIVKATKGTWKVASSPLGGASMQVSWPREARAAEVRGTSAAKA